MELEVRIRIFGDLDLLPLKLQRLLAKVVLLTKNNKKAFLNVCFAYTSRQEMTSAINDLLDGHLEPDLITEDVFRSCFWSGQASNPDLLIRTSGETRLSDFLLWQTSRSVLLFTKKLWPEFSIWDLFKATFYFQRHCKSIRLPYDDKVDVVDDRVLDGQPTNDQDLNTSNQTAQSFLESLYLKREARLKQLACDQI